MNRATLLGVVALAGIPAAAHAQSLITGGGSITTGNTYPPEYSKFNPGSGAFRRPAPPPATFDTYWAADSAIGQEAFLNDDLSCDIDAVTGANGGACTGQDGAPGNTVSYAASDIALSPTQIDSWATSPFGQSVAGNLIQLPSMGAGVAIPVVNPAIMSNGALTLSDNDLCGIFSGLITNFDQITDSATTPAPGAFQLVYRTDGDGATFWLTNHLAAVCNGGNSNIVFTPTTNFASLFPGGTPPANFVATAGGAALASYMAGCSGPVQFALGYDTPDYTTIDPKSGASIACRTQMSPGSSVAPKSPLVAAGLQVAGNAYTPTVANIALGLSNPQIGSDLKPPQNAIEGANPALWAPIVQTVNVGYPIVGYTSFNFAQCYADPNVGAALILFLKDHYTQARYGTIENANGFVTLQQLKKSGYLADVEHNLLANKRGWNDNIDNPTACAGEAGR
jgi:phosphate transport system substrate-binding protein